MTVQFWLGVDNKIGIDIWFKKYQHDDESFDDWLDRVSGGDAEMRQLIIDKKFMFAGRILAGRGVASKSNKVSLSNCYVCEPPEDSLESIYDCARDMARTYSYGGGCGVDISNLAPKGAIIHNAAKETSGAVSFMDLFAMSTALIGQHGRRGALMISIDGKHPDLLDFIDAKRDLTKLTKANTSVRIHDDFMQAVENGEQYLLHYTREATGERINKKVDAREVFHRIAENNWLMGEPGVLFWDTIEDWNLLSEDADFEYAGVNPCWGYDMQLLTADGYKCIGDLDGQTVDIINVNGNVVKSKVWCTGERETVRVKLGTRDIICTPEHRFMTADGCVCMAKDLKGKYLMPCTRCNKTFDPFYVKLGFIQGDGILGCLANKACNSVDVCIGTKDIEIRDLFSDEVYTSSSDDIIHLKGFKDSLIDLGFSSNRLPERGFPATYDTWTRLQKASFLHGCYSANGSVIKHGRVSYKTTCRGFADKLVATLDRDFQIKAYITTNRAHEVEFSNGTYMCKESYDVNICRQKDITAFAAEINFCQQYKRVQLAQMLMNRAPYVNNVEPNGVAKVYDFSEPETHWGIIEGCVAHNCAEEPLPANSACLLGSINLAAFVNKQDDGDPYFDMDGFATTVRAAVRALNRVLDEGLNCHPLPQQTAQARMWRAIGLGVFGVGDMCVKLEMPYGSGDSLKMCEDIGHTMINEALWQSALLAMEEGPYPAYDASAVMSSEFFKTNADDETKAVVAKYGLRNSQLLTIPPTGTISTMLGVSNGIEPIYAVSYTRKTESVYGHDVYYKTFAPVVQQYMDEHNITSEDDLPDFITASTAGRLNYRSRINMQAAWQKYIDASISSTVNLPESATVEDVEHVYMAAWKHHLKGVTVFRDNCARAGILTTGDHSAPEAPVAPEPRPLQQNVYGTTSNTTIPCGDLHITCNSDGIGPCQLIVTPGKAGGCRAQSTALGNMVSLALRSGIKPQYIIDQLKGIRCPSSFHRPGTDAISCPDAIGKALERFMGGSKEQAAEQPEPAPQAPTQPDSDDVCPICHTPFAHEGGCVTCKNCGYSKCG